MKKNIIRFAAAALIAAACCSAFAQETEASEKNDFDGAKEYFHFGLNRDVAFFNGKSDTKIISLGIASAGDKNICGLQESLFWSNVENRLTGVQESGIGAFAGGGFSGVQHSAGFNYANGVSYGAQVTYGFNRADEITGAQVAYGLNKARVVHGLQFGLINIADESDATFGLINIIKNGVHDFGIGIDSNQNVYFQIQEGGKELFTNIGVSGKLQKDFFAGDYCDLWIGLGTRDQWGMFSFDLEFLWKFTVCQEARQLAEDARQAVKDEDDDKADELMEQLKNFQVPHLRFTVNFEPVKHFSVFASAGCDFRLEKFNDEAFLHKEHKLSGSFEWDEGRRAYLYPVFSAGVKIR